MWSRFVDSYVPQTKNLNLAARLVKKLYPINHLAGIMEYILTLYGFDKNDTKISVLSSGLINSTWRLDVMHRSFILQRVNHSVFKSPSDIDYNINLISEHIERSNPSYTHLQLVPALNGTTLVQDDTGNYYRAFIWLDGVTFEVLNDSSLAFEAARKFGEYTRILSNISVADIRVALPQFHDLTLRVNQYHQSLAHASASRLDASTKAINWINTFEYVHGQYLTSLEVIKTRVVHHDTKISNVLFDHNNKGIKCISMSGERRNQFE